MWFYLPAVLIPSLLVVGLSKLIWKREITLKEWGMQFVGLLVGAFISVCLIAISSMMYSGDISIFNGYVTDKARVEVSCEHQYVCGETCHTVTERDSQGRTSSRRVCEPVYCDEHSHDVDWDVHTTLGTWTINRIDRQGLKEPPRWELVEPGDPVAEARSVANFLLLDENRFLTDPAIMEKYKDKLMTYPIPKDYYNITRVLNDNNQDYDAINIWLNDQLREDGAKYELNIVLVVTTNPVDYYYAMMQWWRGARKNDVIIFYGVDDMEKIQWSKAISFADGQNNQVMLSGLQSMTYGRDFGVGLVKEQYAKITKEFNRIPNSTFKYMKEGWTPPVWWVVCISIVNLLVTIGFTWFVVKEDFV